MPAELRRMVNSVTLSGDRNADDNAWNGRYNRDQQQEGRTPDAANYNDWAARYRQELRGPRSPFRSYASAGRAGDITFYPTSWDPRQQQAYIDSTIIHESGHTYSARNFPGFEQWDRARTSDAIVPSNYARNAATEDFSEALSLYYVVRGTPQEAELRRLLPARFEIIDQHFPGWTKR
jgi:type VI secretion system secreted protein VgrG